MKNLFLLSSIVIACGAQAALPKAVLSNIPGAATNVIPGGAFWQAGDADAFDAIRFSPDRSLWAISGEQENGTTDLDIIVRGTTSPWAVTHVVALEGAPTFLETNELWVTIRDSMSVANNGSVFFGADTDSPTTSDDVAVEWNIGTTLLGREGSPVPGLTDVNFGAGNNSVHATNDGRKRWVSTGLTGAGVLTGQTQMIYETYLGTSTVLARSGISVPTGQLISPDQVITTFTGDRLQSAAYSGEIFYNVVLAGPAASNVAMVLDSAIHLQETQTYSGFSTGVTSLSSGDAHTITANGQYKMSRAALLTSAIDVCVLNGSVVAATDAPIAPSSSELWDDAPYAPTFIYSTCNGYGETVIGGTTNNANALTNAVIMFSAAGKSTEVAREGDPVDLDGNGIADDNAFISIFEDNKLTVTDGNVAYFSVEVVDASSVFVGDVVVAVVLPLTGDVDDSGEVDAADIDLVIAQFGSTTPGIPEDVDGSGEVDAADIDIVIANFGRTR